MFCCVTDVVVLISRTIFFSLSLVFFLPPLEVIKCPLFYLVPLILKRQNLQTWCPLSHIRDYVHWNSSIESFREHGHDQETRVRRPYRRYLVVRKEFSVSILPYLTSSGSTLEDVLLGVW